METKWHTNKVSSIAIGRQRLHYILMQFSGFRYGVLFWALFWLLYGYHHVMRMSSLYPPSVLQNIAIRFRLVAICRVLFRALHGMDITVCIVLLQHYDNRKTEISSKQSTERAKAEHVCTYIYIYMYGVWRLLDLSESRHTIHSKCQAFESNGCI